MEVRLGVFIAVLNLQAVPGDNIAKGKVARQANTFTDADNVTYEAWRTLDPAYVDIGSYSEFKNPQFWEVDLASYYNIDCINILAPGNGFGNWWMDNAWVEVTEHDRDVDPNTPSIRCGTIPDTMSRGQKFTFSCNPPFPVRYVRVRRSGYVKLVIGQVEVHGTGVDDVCFRSSYTPVQSTNMNSSYILQSTSASTPAECSAICDRLSMCLHFSHSLTAPPSANCLLTDHGMPDTEVSGDWVLYQRDGCW